MESQAKGASVEPRAATVPGLSIAFQPIADTSAARVYAYEALVRGRDGESAPQIRETLDGEARRDFDRRCAAAAIRWSMSAGLGSGGARLCIPIQAESVGAPGEFLQPILHAARIAGLIPERLIFALEGYQHLSGAALAEIVDVFGKLGPATVFVGIGRDEEGLGKCGRYMPHAVKLEPERVREVANSWSKRIALEELVPRIRKLNLRVIAMGVDSEPVFQRVRGYGLHLIQGDYVGAPETGALPPYTLQRRAA
jgi:EAL domain-containing protein (putative c-di-GMP-specific phosphodiesterase class I)